MGAEKDLRKQKKVTAEVTIDPSGLATEATLNGLKTFVESDSKFADNTAQLNGSANAASFGLATVDLTRKQLMVINHSTKKMWVSRNTPAVVGEGIPLNKDEIYIEDIYRGALYAIYESGTGNLFTVIKDTV